MAASDYPTSLYLWLPGELATAGQPLGHAAVSADRGAGEAARRRDALPVEGVAEGRRDGARLGRQLAVSAAGGAGRIRQPAEAVQQYGPQPSRSLLHQDAA